MPLPSQNIETFAHEVSLVLSPNIQGNEQLHIEYNRQSIIITLSRKINFKHNFIVWMTIPYTVALDLAQAELSLILSYLRIMLKQVMATKMAGRYKVVLEMA